MTIEEIVEATGVPANLLRRSGACIIWEGTLEQGTRPYYRQRPVRRALWQQVHGPLAKGEAVVTCCPRQIARCVALEHCAVASGSRHRARGGEGLVMPRQRHNTFGYIFTPHPR